MFKSEQLKTLLEKEKFENALELLVDTYIKSEGEEKRSFIPELTKIGIKYPKSTVSLIEIAKKQDEETYDILFNAIFDIISNSPETHVDLVPLLIKELRNQSVYARIKQALGLIRVKVPREYVDKIMDSLKNKEDPDRWRYILELGSIGVKFPEINDIIIPYLTNLLNDENEQVRAAATDTLEKIRTQAPVKPTVDPTPQIKAQTEDESGIVRDVAKEALNNIEKTDEVEGMVEGKKKPKKT